MKDIIEAMLMFGVVVLILIFGAVFVAAIKILVSVFERLFD